jgi:hypothetical protein
MIAAAKLFVELTWAEAGGVIAGGVLAGLLTYAFLREMMRSARAQQSSRS